MNRYGRILCLEIFGESHGPGVGCVLDGVPAGLPVDEDEIQQALDRRRPGQSRLTTQRREPDRVRIQSGVYQGRATGAPIAMWIENQDARSTDYAPRLEVPRPGHADYPAEVASGGHWDPRGGGHSSGRLTAPLVAAGAIAAALLRRDGIEVAAHLHQVGALAGEAGVHGVAEIREAVRESPMPTAHLDLRQRFVELVEGVRRDGDSLGGTVEVVAEGMPLGLGEPWCDSVESRLAHLYFAIPGVKGVDFGAGFDSVAMRGSEHNDAYEIGHDGAIRPRTNHAGGILGGLASGAPLRARVALKPTSSIFKSQQSVDLATGEEVSLELKGRHDPLIALRAVVAVEAATALVLADLLACQRARPPIEPREK
jgi:chorismate synthase